eukprot:11290052-Alexandrium_andersonii.AAC.1
MYEREHSENWLRAQSVFWGGAAFGDGPWDWDLSGKWLYTHTPEIVAVSYTHLRAHETSAHL